MDKNLQMEIILNLSPIDIIKYCTTGKYQNENICNSYIFWIKKLERDYPDEMNKVRQKGIQIINPKKLYMERFITVSRKIEKFIPQVITYHIGPDFIKYLSQEYKDELFTALYHGYNIIKNYDFTKNNNPKDDIMRDIMVDEISYLLPEPAYEISYDHWENFYEVIMMRFIHDLLKENLKDFLV